MRSMGSMSRISAGLLMFEQAQGELRVLIVHPGGPFAKKKDAGHWSIPKGEVDEGEDLLACACREFAEETGHAAGEGPFIPLGSILQKGGKTVHAWAFAGKWQPEQFSSNHFEMEWPKGSGKTASYPEVDRAEMLTIAAATPLIKETQIPFLDRLSALLKA